MQSFLVFSSVLLWVVVLFNMLLTLALVRRLSNGNKQSGLNKGVKAPDFTAQTLDGKTVTLANYLGKQVAFLFISPHCNPCKEKIPEYQALSPFAKRAGVELALVDVTGPIADMQAVVNDLKIDIPILFAPQDNNLLSKKYKVGSTPSYCLVDENGRVHSTGYPGIEAQAEWKQLVSEWKDGATNIQN